ncbi:MAG: GNAT family N-acetyltransferase [Alphaproteobacteria bacterium]|nr:GNAT family N-acetyltransferase [Alphaproteobacteria bacterium]
MNLKAVVAATPDAIQRVFAVRAAVFMSEQDCPYDEEFDGNDFCATHILGLANDEPAAVLRVRFFAEFAKLERLAVLPRFRRTLISKMVVDAGIEIARRKGYRALYGHAQKRLARFWSRFGFQPLKKNFKLVYSDHEYIEMAAYIEPHESPITMMSDPYIIVRPEGDWDSLGALDRSAARPATNPH